MTSKRKKQLVVANKKYRSKNVRKLRAYNKAYRAANVERTVKWQHTARLSRYHLTDEQYIEILKTQGGQCALCEGNAAHIDHDHKTGRVRGVLCKACNLMLGVFEKRPTWVNKATEYLKEL